ncbi:MAG: hypothetical protein FWD81_01220 [Methanomassiliicoccaceae archaeon]|nr:hypothetical protein [Methanomassiliicoccaceae archaeon]
MTVWLCRAGLQGQYLNKFIEQKKIFLIGNVGIDLTGKTDMQELMKKISHAYPTEPDGSITTMSVQARAFATKMKVGDWVAVPNLQEKLLYIGEVTGKYEFDGTKSELKHSHSVSWKHGAWQRDSFDEATLRSVDAFDSFMMLFRLKQDKQIKEVVGSNKPFAKIKAAAEQKKSVNKPETEPLEETEPTLVDTSEIAEVIAEVRKVIAEVRETITEVKKATITQVAEVKKVIMEVKDAVDDAANCCSSDNESCGTKVIYTNYDRWYYETPRERRRFRF